MRMTLQQAIDRARLNQKSYGGVWEVRVIAQSLVIQMVEAGGMAQQGKQHFCTEMKQ